MLFLRKNDPGPVRPLAPASKVPLPTSIDDLQSTRFYKEAVSYLENYPSRSLVSDESRAALFDLQMAARRRRPGAIVVMDNAKQSGPFRAARDFLTINPLWRELGNAIAGAAPSSPFNPPDGRPRPALLDSEAGPGVPYCRPRTEAASPAHRRKPSLSSIFRAFRQNTVPIDVKAIGRIGNDATDAATIKHCFDSMLELPSGANDMIEVDFSWQADAGASPLALASSPEPIAC